MAIIKILSSKGSVNNIINYVLNKEKTNERIISGKDCSPFNATEEMNVTKNLYGKTDKISFHHIIQSFKPGETTPEKAHEIGLELAEKQFKYHEVLIATHKDKEHMHNHFIINSVSFKDGHKLISNKDTLREIKLESNRICQREHLSTIDKPYAKNRYSMAEYKLAEKGLPIWKEQLRSAIDESKKNAKNFLELKEHLSQNFGIKMKIQNKNLSFLHPDKINYCRGAKLGGAYTKEGMTDYFERKPEMPKERTKSVKPVSKSHLPGMEAIGSGIEKFAHKIARDIEKEKIRVDKPDTSLKKQIVKNKERDRDR